MTATNATHNAFDQERAEAAVRELLIAVGEDPDREGLQDTPARVARAYQEVFAGLHCDPTVVLERTFAEDHQELVLVRDIDLLPRAWHHLVPFCGKAHIGYIQRKNDHVCRPVNSPWRYVRGTGRKRPASQIWMR